MCLVCAHPRWGVLQHPAPTWRGPVVPDTRRGPRHPTAQGETPTQHLPETGNQERETRSSIHPFPKDGKPHMEPVLVPIKLGCRHCHEVVAKDAVARLLGAVTHATEFYAVGPDDPDPCAVTAAYDASEDATRTTLGITLGIIER